MSNEKYRDLEQLPQFPAIATKVLRVLSHDDAHVKEIADLVRADLALASGLLRMANSALYARSSPATSIQSALAYLGFEEVRRFVLAASMKSVFQTALRLDLLRGIWRHSLACALVCEELSSACPATLGRDDQAYTAGLLHDIGRLGLFVVHPQQYADLLTGPPNGTDMLERERQAFGVDHCEAGGWLAKSWGLPVQVQIVAAGHHRPPDSSAFDLASLVRVGILLADNLGFDLAPPAQAHTLQAIRAMLPHTAQYRFDPEPVAMKARISGKLDAFD